MIQKIDHINISVTNLEEATNFFVDLLDFCVEKEGLLEGKWIDRVVGLDDVKAKYVQLVLPSAATRIELIQYYNPIGEKDTNTGKSNQIGIRHIAFEVKGIEAVYSNLQKSGVKIISELQVYNKVKKLCYFVGPDDIILELAEYAVEGETYY